jgi:hypothetical protein
MSNNNDLIEANRERLLAWEKEGAIVLLDGHANWRA